jgi:hypothetical protein
MSHADRIRSLVDSYRLEVDGVAFWVPYWVNNPKLMGNATAPGVRGAFKGKGTPGQLVLSLQRVLAGGEHHPRTADGYRELMRSRGLGIDCSGFIYHVLDGWLRARGQGSLSSRLVTDREAVLEALRQRPSWQHRGVSEAEIHSWPHWVPLQLVYQRFHKSPRMLTAVATLVHPQVVEAVAAARDILPGDMIKFTSKQWGDHIALVVEQRSNELVIAESTEPADRLGGVTYSRVKITDPQRGLEYQGWERAASYDPGGATRDGVWRLKGLTDAG